MPKTERSVKEICHEAARRCARSRFCIPSLLLYELDPTKVLRPIVDGMGPRLDPTTGKQMTYIHYFGDLSVKFDKLFSPSLVEVKRQPCWSVFDFERNEAVLALLLLGEVMDA